MGFSCGIVGLPNIGKSTLFNALTGGNAPSSNYPFCTVDPNQGVVTVPDHRFDYICDLVKPKSRVPAIMSFTDIAGLVRGAHSGEGLGNQFLGNIQQVEAIVHVVRLFPDPTIHHVDPTIDPLKDLSTIYMEMALKDIERVQSRIARISKLATSSKNKVAQKEMSHLNDVLDFLNSDSFSTSFVPSQGGDEESIDDLRLLCLKPAMIMANVSEEQFKNQENCEELCTLKDFAKKKNIPLIPVSARIEEEISKLPSEDRELFLDDLGLKESTLPTLIHEGYKLLALITYFTAGEKEVRGWTIPQNTLAPQAAGKIHTDFEKGFIRAEVISWEDYEMYKGNMALLREKGKFRVEGQNYVMCDGDIVHYRFNV